MSSRRFDLKSLTIGILSTLLFMSLLSAKKSETKFDDINVSSITVRRDGFIRILSDSDDYTVLISGEGQTGGNIYLANALGMPVAVLGSNIEGQGRFVTYNQTGKVSAHMGTGPNGEGFLRTFNTRESPTAYLGGSTKGGGQLTTFNEVDKETVFLGTGSGGVGILRTANEYGKMSVYVGTSNSNTGMILLCDRDGMSQWVKKVN